MNDAQCLSERKWEKAGSQLKFTGDRKEKEAATNTTGQEGALENVLGCDAL